MLKKEEVIVEVYRELSRERVYFKGQFYVDKVFAEYKGRREWVVVFNVGDGVGVVPITKDQKIVLVREFRVGAKEVQWNVPGGGRRVNEAIEETARREYFEEVGGELEELEYLGKFNSIPAYLEGELHYFIGWNATFHESKEKDAFLPVKEIKAFSIEELEELIDNGLIPHTGSLAALLLVLRRYPSLRKDKG